MSENKEASENTNLVMDSDFSHILHIIPGMINTLKQTSCDVVIASRYVKGGSIQGMII